MNKGNIKFKKSELDTMVTKHLIKEGILSKSQLTNLVGKDSNKKLRTPEEIADRQTSGNGPDLVGEVNKDSKGIEDAEADALAPQELVDVLESLDKTLSLLSKAAIKHGKNEKQKDKLFKIYDEINKLKTKIIKENNISH